MNNQIIEILETALLFSLNPTTWVIVFFLSIWAKQLWIPAISGVVAQIASLIPLAIYLDRVNGTIVYELFDGEGIADIVFFFSAPVLSGMMISVLVIPLVRHRWFKQPASSNVS